MDSLSRLEAHSIFLLREAYASFRDLAMLWSIGKDSTVLLWLARKAFFGHVPFPLIHIDTGFKIPEMIAYRDRLALEWKLDLRLGRNDEALAHGNTFASGRLDRLSCCKALKTDALKRALSGERRLRLDHRAGSFVPDFDRAPFTAVIAGIRSDEEGSRSKERWFSPRDAAGLWDVGDQPPEFWNQFNTDFPPGTHVRIHPLLDWKELDVWEYIRREGIPTVSLYYDQGQGRRYRSLGCQPCTSPIESDARDVGSVVAELKNGKLARVAERSGRAQDKDDGGTLETLRRDGYM